MTLIIWGYGRLSFDVSKGYQDSTAAQREAVERWAASNDGRLVRWFEDGDRSAYQVGVVREEWESMLDLLDVLPADQRPDALVGYHYKRLCRRFGDHARLRALVQAGLRVVTVSDSTDSLTPMGRMMQSWAAEMAEEESKEIGERVRLKAAHRLRRGLLTACGVRPFGFDKEIVGERRHKRAIYRIREDEAACIREAVQRFLAGEPVTSVKRDFQARGVKSPLGRPMSSTVLSGILQHPRNAGYVRDHEGNLVRPTGDDARYAIPAIITLDQFRLVEAKFAARKTGAAPPRSVRRHWLSGFLRCGRCGCGLQSGMGSYSTAAGRMRRPVYACYTTKAGGCGGVTVSRPEAEAYFEDLLLNGIESGVAERIAGDITDNSQELIDTIASDRAYLQQYIRDAALAGLTVGEIAAGRQAVADRLADNENQLQRLMARAGSPASILSRRDHVRHAWAEASPQVKRAILDQLLEPVTVLLVGRGRKTPFADRIEPAQWKA